ncbi:MAG TPA: Crp/Fnr family transcriptional regulator [Nitrosomonas sp.]|nr:Crp/Fnr family transcriptional regulator [Nitrosomonas sp.]
MKKNFTVNAELDRKFPPLIRRLLFLQPLSVEEIAVLMRMHEKPHFIDERTIFLNQGDVQKNCYIVTKGWAYRFDELSDGNRQIINYYLPGDIISPFAVVMPKANYSVASITRLEVCVFEPDYLVELFATQPKLGLLYGWMLGRDDSLVAEHVVRVGRRSAYKRTAHLLLELFYRLKIIGETEDKTFSMPISQNLLADTLGLSFVHMNRTLRKLRMDNLISITSNEVILLDIDRLKQLAEYQICYMERIKNLSAVIQDLDIDDTRSSSNVA